MTIGEKIRNLRLIKGFSQENIASTLGISTIAYGDIERNKTDISYSRLEQVANALGLTPPDLLNFGEKISNIFNNCQQEQVITGNGNSIHSHKELIHQIEKNQLEISLLRSEKEKLEMELRYLKGN